MLSYISKGMALLRGVALALIQWARLQWPLGNASLGFAVLGTLCGIFAGIMWFRLAEMLAFLAMLSFALWTIGTVAPRTQRVVAFLVFLAVGLLLIFSIDGYRVALERSAAERIARMQAEDKRQEIERHREASQDEWERLEENPSGLIPDEQDDTRGCDQDVNRQFLTVVLGPDYLGTSRVPFSPIFIEGKPFLTIDQDPFSRRILVSFDVYDKSNNLLARVRRNTVTVPPLHAFRVPRTDLHHVIVWDERGSEALNVYYENKSHLIVTGNLIMDGHIISIRKDDLRADGVPIKDVSLCDVGAINIHGHNVEVGFVR